MPPRARHLSAGSPARQPRWGARAGLGPRERQGIVAKRDPSVAESVLETRESTVLDLIDELLNKGVLADGDLTLGVAGIDLIYLSLSTLLCAADRVLPPDPNAPKRRSRHRQPGASKRPR